MYHLPVITDKEWEKLANLQRVVSRRQKRSRNREKALNRLRRYRQQLTRRKHNALHQLTTELADRYSVIVLEDLRIRNMTKSAKGTLEAPGSNVAQKSGLNRAILDQCWYEFERQLTYKLDARGHRELWKVPAKNTSRQCSACGHTAAENRESQAVFACQACGHEQHADTNAARNLIALAATGQGVLIVPSGGTPGRGALTRRNACEDRDPLKTPEGPGSPQEREGARSNGHSPRAPQANAMPLPLAVAGRNPGL